MRRIPLFIQIPTSTNVGRSLEAIRESDLFDTRMREFTPLFITELLSSRPCICVFSIPDAASARSACNFLYQLQETRKKVGETKKDTSIRVVMVIDSQEIQIQRWQPIGVSEYIFAPVVPKTIVHKLSIHHQVATELEVDDSTDSQFYHWKGSTVTAKVVTEVILVKGIEKTPEETIYVPAYPAGASSTRENQFKEIQIITSFPELKHTEGSWIQTRPGSEKEEPTWNWVSNKNVPALKNVSYEFKGNLPRYSEKDSSWKFSGKTVQLLKTEYNQPVQLLSYGRTNPEQLEIKKGTGIVIQKTNLKILELQSLETPKPQEMNRSTHTTVTQSKPRAGTAVIENQVKSAPAQTTTVTRTQPLQNSEYSVKNYSQPSQSKDDSYQVKSANVAPTKNTNENFSSTQATSQLQMPGSSQRLAGTTSNTSTTISSSPPRPNTSPDDTSSLQVKSSTSASLPSFPQSTHQTKTSVQQSARELNASSGNSRPNSNNETIEVKIVTQSTSQNVSSSPKSQKSEMNDAENYEHRSHAKLQESQSKTTISKETNSVDSNTVIHQDQNLGTEKTLNSYQSKDAESGSDTYISSGESSEEDSQRTFSSDSEIDHKVTLKAGENTETNLNIHNTNENLRRKRKSSGADDLQDDGAISGKDPTHLDSKQENIPPPPIDSKTIEAPEFEVKPLMDPRELKSRSWFSGFFKSIADLFK